MTTPGPSGALSLTAHSGFPVQSCTACPTLVHPHLLSPLRLANSGSLQLVLRNSLCLHSQHTCAHAHCLELCGTHTFLHIFTITVFVLLFEVSS